MLNFDLAELSHIVQDGTLSLEVRMALILINHGYSPNDLVNLTTLPKCDWILFEKPFIKTFKKHHQAAPFGDINTQELISILQPYLK